MKKSFSIGGPSKIEITNIETGEKFTYNAIITEHQISYQRDPVYMLNNGSTAVDRVAPSVKDITLRFKEFKTFQEILSQKVSTISETEMKEEIL